MHEKFVEIIRDSKLAMYILAKPEEDEFALVAVGPQAADVQTGLVTRGFRFAGIVGLVDGAPRSAFAIELSEMTFETLSSAYVQLVMDEIDGRLAARNGEPWVGRTYQMPTNMQVN